jgi:HUS1 checkpoint protein
MLPPLAKMRAIVERMRNLSDVIAVRANSSGCLQLSASTEVVKADITWTNCSHPRIGKFAARSSYSHLLCYRCLAYSFNSVAANSASQDNTSAENEEQEPQRPDPKQLFSVLTHTRSFLKFLGAHAVSKTTIACAKGPAFHPLTHLTISNL